MTTKMKHLFFHICIMISVMSSAQIPVDFQIGDSIFYNYTELKLPSDTFEVIIIACDSTQCRIIRNGDDDIAPAFPAYNVITFTGYMVTNPVQTFFLDEFKNELSDQIRILLWQKN